MADPFSIVTGSLTLLKLSGRIIEECKNIISAAKNAPKELKSILIEVSALEAALKSLTFLAGEDSEFAEQATNTVGVKSAVTNCEATLDDLANELGSLSIGNATQIGTSKRRRVKEAIKWTWKEAEVKKLLNDVLQHKTTITLGLLSQTARDVGDIKKSVQQIQEDLSHGQRRDIASWLETTNPSQSHNFAKDLYESHTGEWVLRLPQWKAWLEENESTRFLWIYGIPGAGKTILASFLIGLCQKSCRNQGKDNTTACIYYYCSYRNNQDETSPLLQWIVGQLCRLTECIPKAIHDTYHLNQHPRTEVLLDTIGVLLSSMQRVYLVVDALDESMPRTGLPELLETLVTHSRFQKLQILATSRKYVEIESILSRISTPISMSNEEVDKDIRVYAQAEIKRKCSQWSEDLKSEALEALVHGAEGMFRWVVCQIDILRRRRAPDIRSALKRLPKTIEDTYEIILSEIREEDRPLVRLAFIFINGHDKVPGNTPIPAEILCTILEQTLTSQGGHEEERELDYSELWGVCGCLLSVDWVKDPDKRRAADGVHRRFMSARLAHYTVREYLFSDRITSGNARFFALTDQEVIAVFLRFVSNSAVRLELDDVNPDYWEDLDSYCMRAAWAAPSVDEMEAQIAASDELWKAQTKVWKQPRFYFHISGMFADGFYSGTDVMTNFPFLDNYRDIYVDSTVRQARVILILFYYNRLKLAKRFLSEYGVRILCHTKLLCGMDGFDDEEATALEGLWAGSSFGRIGGRDHFTRTIRLAATFPDQDGGLLLQAVRLHHPELLECCKDSGGARRCEVLDHVKGLLMKLDNCPCEITPLQVAVYNWDLLAARFLLEAGADPNGTGIEDGKPAPFYAFPINDIDDWRHTSPLHILKNARPLEVEKCEWIRLMDDDIAEREENLDDLKDLLESYGARDFIATSPGQMENLTTNTTDQENRDWKSAVLL